MLTFSEPYVNLSMPLVFHIPLWNIHLLIPFHIPLVSQGWGKSMKVESKADAVYGGRRQCKAAFCPLAP